MFSGENPLNSLKFTSFPHLGAKRVLGGAPARQTMETAVKPIVSGGYLGCQNGKRVENTTEIGFKVYFCEDHKISTKTQFLWFLVEIL